MALFAEAIAIRYGEEFGRIPSLASYVDDIFGGFKFCSVYHKALHFREYMCKTGLSLTLRFNMRPKKTPLPAKQLVILGRLWDTEANVVRTSEKKIEKYTSRISGLLKQKLVTRKDLEQIHGNLNYVAAIEPFGRPFLAPLTAAYSSKPYKVGFTLPRLARRGLQF